MVNEFKGEPVNTIIYTSILIFNEAEKLVHYRAILFKCAL